jgi:enoyl-CoA hydratase/carnithine racemase
MIAAINGYCVGGGFGLALSCDLRIAGPDSKIGPSGLRRGVYQGGTQTQRLIRLITFPKALEMLLLSKYVSGTEAAEMGLVNEVVDEQLVLPRAMELAGHIAEFNPEAVRATKMMAYRGLHLDWEAAFAFDLEALDASMRTASAQEGFGSFTEKRPADFRTVDPSKSIEDQ